MAAAPTGIGSFETARAVVYFQAALIVNPQHALAANELGVVLARHGRLADAKAALLHSVRVAPQPAAWRNLALVHHGLGEAELAERANWQSQQTSQDPQAGAEAAAANVQWIDPATFARSGQFSADAPPASAPPTITVPQAAGPQTAAHTPQPAEEQTSQSASSWFPWARTKR
jgi:tetratricopeptide (TPR) repeat protein